MNNKIKITLFLLATIEIGLIGLGLFSSQNPLGAIPKTIIDLSVKDYDLTDEEKELAEDYIYMGVAEKKAVAIVEYFSDKGKITIDKEPYLTIGGTTSEYYEWIRICNNAFILMKKPILQIENKESFFNECNILIKEARKLLEKSMIAP